MAAVVWEPTAAALEAALAAIGNTAIGYAIGRRILQTLQRTGADYDERFTPAVDAKKAEVDAYNTTTQATWLAETSNRFGAVDAVARWAEGVQADANAGELDQYVHGGKPLSPGAGIGYDASGGAAAARATIGTMRLEALEPGTFGNATAVTVADAAGGAPAFHLTIARGEYAEVYPALQPGSSLGTSLLVGALDWGDVPARPANGSYSLGGGAGASVAQLKERIGRAASLPALTAEQKRIVREYEKLVDDVVKKRPVLRGHSASSLEDTLESAIAEAEAWMEAQ